jgi:hypothetical protein
MLIKSELKIMLIKEQELNACLYMLDPLMDIMVFWVFCAV